jgi:hypothetical protein
MYYLLKERFLLRGWEKLPYAIVDRIYGNAIFIRREEFDVISLCNGAINMDLPIIPGKTKEMVGRMEKNGFVEARETPAQLLPDQEFQRLESRQSATEARVDNIEKKMITKEDLSDLMKLFDQGITNEEILILDGQRFKADIAYQQIYRKAKKKITVFDDYKHRSRTGYALHRQTGVSFVFHNRQFESARQKIKYR